MRFFAKLVNFSNPSDLTWRIWKGEDKAIPDGPSTNWWKEGLMVRIESH
jgi:hypothetical protein